MLYTTAMDQSFIAILYKKMVRTARVNIIKVNGYMLMGSDSVIFILSSILLRMGGWGGAALKEKNV